MSEVLKKRLVEIYKRGKIPDSGEYIKLLDRINYTLTHEEEAIRPYGKAGLPGGLINLKKNIPTIIVPDLHARMDLILSVLFYVGYGGETVIDQLAKDAIQIICVGDGFHAESRAMTRWKKAFEEYKSSYKHHKNMDEEMTESLGVMEMVMEIKINYPNNFHFLKGNHENIANERGGGNYPFRKFAYEGPMVLEYVNQFYGNDFLQKYYNFEKNLPLFVIGKNFLISHAEPVTFFNREDIINYRVNPDLIIGFTWTDNDSADADSVEKMIKEYVDDTLFETSYYFGGHRPVAALYNKRAGGKYVQIHNPSKFVVALIKAEGNIDLDSDVIEIKDVSKEVIKSFK